MANVYKWTSNPIESSTIIDNTNNSLTLKFNGVDYPIAIDEVGYMSNIIRHESRLVEKIKEQIDAVSIGVDCVIGVSARGNVKEMNVVFIHDVNDTLDLSGTLISVIGEVGYTTGNE